MFMLVFMFMLNNISFPLKNFPLKNLYISLCNTPYLGECTRYHVSSAELFANLRHELDTL